MIESLLPYIGGAFAFLLGLLGVYTKGKRDQARREEHKRANEIIETRERTDAENYLDDDIGAIRDRLLKRGKR